MAAGPAEVVALHEVLGQDGAPVVALVTQVAGVVVHTRLLVLLQEVLLQRHLSSTDEVTAGLLALVHGLHDVDLHVALDAVLGLAGKVTVVALEGLLVHVLVSDVPGEGAGGGAGHVAVGALVVVDVRPHVVPQQSLQGKLLPTIIALVGVLIGDLLPLTVVQEFDPG